MMLVIVSYDVCKLRMKKSIKLVTSICPYEARVMSGLKRKSLSWIDDEASDVCPEFGSAGCPSTGFASLPITNQTGQCPPSRHPRPKLMQPQALGERVRHLMVAPRPRDSDVTGASSSVVRVGPSD